MLVCCQILIQSVMETMVPKLVAEDIPLLNSLLSDVFPGVSYTPAEMTKLREMIKSVCAEMYLVYGDGEEQGVAWVEKVCVIYAVPITAAFFASLLQNCVLVMIPTDIVDSHCHV